MTDMKNAGDDKKGQGTGPTTSNRLLACLIKYVAAERVGYTLPPPGLQ